MHMSKKSQVFMTVLVVVTLITVVSINIIMSSKLEKYDKLIGERQTSMLRAVNDGEKLLAYIDTSAIIARDASYIELAENGGYYAQKCGAYRGSALWYNGDFCFPADLNSEYSEFFNKNMNEKTAKYPQISLPEDNYDLYIGEKEILGIASEKAEIPLIVATSEIEEPAYLSLSYEFDADYPWPVSSTERMWNYVSGCYRSPDAPYETKRIHQGIDIALPVGTSLISTVNGTVTKTCTSATEACGFDTGINCDTAQCGGSGNEVIIESGDVRLRYLHLSRVNVQQGQNVKVGDLIGFSGNTGHSTGPHLHFEFKYKGQNINPLCAYTNEFINRLNFGGGDCKMKYGALTGINKQHPSLAYDCGKMGAK